MQERADETLAVSDTPLTPSISARTFTFQEHKCSCIGQNGAILSLLSGQASMIRTVMVRFNNPSQDMPLLKPRTNYKTLLMAMSSWPYMHEGHHALQTWAQAKLLGTALLCCDCKNNSSSAFWELYCLQHIVSCSSTTEGDLPDLGW